MKNDKYKKQTVILSIGLGCLLILMVGMSYAFLKTSFFGSNTNVLRVGSLSLILDETSGNAITVEDGTPMYDSEGMKQDNYFTFSLKNSGTLDSSYTIYLENQPLDEGDTRVNSNYVRYNLEKDNSVLQPDSLDGDQAIDKGIIKKNQIINYKMRLWFANDIPQSEENKVFKAKLNVVANQNTKLMAQELGLTNDEKNTITKIVFQDSIKSIENESKVWDTSAAKNKTVMARLVPNTDDTTTNTLYVQSDGQIFANYICKIFRDFSLIKSVENIELLNTSATTNMNFMFGGCKSLTNLDVSNFNTSNITNMSGMFYGCSSLTSLNVSSFDTSKVTTMQSMFYNCTNLTTIDVSNFNTSKVTAMNQMFYGCNKLTNLDVSHFNTSKVTRMNQMFHGCSSLTNLDVGNFNTSNVIDMFAMFQNCTSLENINLNSFDTSSVIDMGSMFTDCSQLTNLNVSKFDTSKVTNMSAMFSGCSQLTDLNVSKFDTSNVTNMTGMFRRCSNLTSLNLNNFDTSNVISMLCLFQSCTNLVSLNIDNFDTSKVTNMGCFFQNCISLESLNLNSFDTLNVTNMSAMFQNCNNLKKLDLKRATFDNVSNYTSVFASIPADIKITTKNETTKAWLEDKLGGKGEVTVA